NIDIAIACKIGAGSIAQGYVEVASGVKKSANAHGCVLRATDVDGQCINTDRCVVVGGVGRECAPTNGRVGVGGGVAGEGYKTNSRVVAASGVAKERERPIGGIEGASGVA